VGRGDKHLLETVECEDRAGRVSLMHSPTSFEGFSSKFDVRIWLELMASPAAAWSSRHSSPFWPRRAGCEELGSGGGLLGDVDAGLNSGRKPLLTLVV
jgi:hypothetical protein